MNYLIDTLIAAWHLACAVSPYLLLGFFLSGLVRLWVPSKVTSPHFSKKGLGSVIRGALYGLALPIASGKTLSKAIQLRRLGASRGGTISFLTSASQSGIDSFAVVYALIGLPFAIIRVVVSFLTSLFVGFLVTTSPDEKAHKSRSHHKRKASFFQRMYGAEAEKEKNDSLLHVIKNAFFYSFVRMPRHVGGWLVVGLLVAGFILVCVPDDTFEFFLNDSIFSIFFVLILVPLMHVCATGTLPIAYALMLRGITPGAIIVLLMAGVATNLSSMKLIRGTMGWRVLILYVAGVVFCSIMFGVMIDTRLPHALFAVSPLRYFGASATEPEWWATAMTIVLFILICIGHLQSLQYHRRHHHRHQESQMLKDVVTVMLFDVTGMTDRNSAILIQKSISSMEAIEGCEVSFTHGQAMVKGVNLRAENIVNAIESLGFEASYLQQIDVEETV